MKTYFGNSEGNATIFAREIKKANGSFTAYSIAVSKKEEDGTYKNASLDAQFSKNALKSLARLDPDKVLDNGVEMYNVCVRGWLTVKERKTDDKTKNFVAVFINEVAVPL